MEAARRSGSSGPVVLARSTGCSSSEEWLGLPRSSERCDLVSQRLRASRLGPLGDRSGWAAVSGCWSKRLPIPFGLVPAEPLRAGSEDALSGASPAGLPESPARAWLGNRQRSPGQRQRCALVLSGSRPVQPFGDCPGGQSCGAGSGSCRKTSAGHRCPRDGSSRLFVTPAQVGLSRDSSSRTPEPRATPGGAPQGTQIGQALKYRVPLSAKQETARADWIQSGARVKVSLSTA